MTDQSVTVTDLEDTSEKQRTKTFTFDHAFWSFGDFYNDEKGYSHPNPGGHYTD